MPRKEHMTFRLSKDLSLKLRKYASEKDLSVSEVIVSCIASKFDDESDWDYLRDRMIAFRHSLERIESKADYSLEAISLVMDVFGRNIPIPQKEQMEQLRDIGPKRHERFIEVLKGSYEKGKGSCFQAYRRVPAAAVEKIE